MSWKKYKKKDLEKENGRFILFTEAKIKLPLFNKDNNYIIVKYQQGVLYDTKEIYLQQFNYKMYKILYYMEIPDEKAFLSEIRKEKIDKIMGN